MKIISVLLTMLVCFFSLIGIIMLAQRFGFSPEQFHNPDVTFEPSTYLTVLAILLTPILIVLFVQYCFHKKSILELGFSKINFRDFILFTLIAILIKSMATIVAISCSPGSQISSAISSVNFASWTPYFLWFLFTLLLNSFNEELIYRSYPFESLREKLSSINIILLSSIVFSVMHFVIESPDLYRFLYRFFFGALAGLIYIRLRSISSIVGLHTGWNFIALSFSDSHWKQGVLVSINNLAKNSEIIANIFVLAIATVVAFFWYRRQASSIQN